MADTKVHTDLDTLNNTVSDFQGVTENRLDSIEHTLKVLEKFQDTIGTTTNNILVSANNTLESADYVIGRTETMTSWYLGGFSAVLVLVSFALIALTWYMTKKTKQETIDMVSGHLQNNDEFKKQVEIQVKREIKKLDIKSMANDMYENAEQKKSDNNEDSIGRNELKRKGDKND